MAKSFAPNACRKGFALMIVLWIVAVLSLMAASFRYFTYHNRRAVYEFQDHMEQMHVVKNGLKVAIGKLLKDTNYFDHYLESWAEPVEIIYENKSVKNLVTITDESSKINVNEAPLDVLSALPGLSEHDLSRIQDFRTEKKLITYLGQINSRFRSAKLDDLLTVFGRPNINLADPQCLEAIFLQAKHPQPEATAKFIAQSQNFALLNKATSAASIQRPFFTPEQADPLFLEQGLVFPRLIVNLVSQCNVNTAPAECLRAFLALLDIPSSEIEELIAYRENIPLRFRDFDQLSFLSDKTRATIKEYLSFETSFYTITSKLVSLDERSTYRVIEAVVEKRIQSSGVQVKVVYWRLHND